MSKGYIVILGAGESGIGAALLAKQKGYKVFVSDKSEIQPNYSKELLTHNIEYEALKHTSARILNADSIIKSPGIPDNTDILNEARAVNIPIISEIEFASNFTNSRLIGVTGSNGKTTTVSLIYAILKHAGLDVGLAGNIGSSFAREVAFNPKPIYVLELSSFQLDGMHNTMLDIAVLLNITPDHLDRYNNSFEDYIASKFRIIQNQNFSQHFVYCADDSVINDWVAKHKLSMNLHPFSLVKKISNGGYLYNNELNFNVNKKKQYNMETKQISLLGKHNIYNTLAAGVVSQILNLKNDSIKQSMLDFKSIGHRLEHVAKINNVTYINDSKATNVNATWYALESMNNSVIWIVGGVDKGNDFEMLSELVKDKVKLIVCIGKDNRKIKESFNDLEIKIFETSSMQEAVNISYEMSIDGDTVLLSPSCASFDYYKDYKDRGEKFISAIKSL